MWFRRIISNLRRNEWFKYETEYIIVKTIYVYILNWQFTVNVAHPHPPDVSIDNDTAGVRDSRHSGDTCHQ